MSVAEGRVQTHVRQLTTPHVLLLGRHVGEDDLPVLESHLLGCYVDICLAHLRINDLGFKNQYGSMFYVKGRINRILLVSQQNSADTCIFSIQL